MSDEMTMGEMKRWLQGLESRMKEMHGENGSALRDIKEGQQQTNTLVRQQNSRIYKLEERASLIEKTQSMMDGELDAIQAAATRAATGAATQAIQDTAPAQKRATAFAAIAAGVTGGGIIGVVKAIELIGKWMN